MTKLKELIFKHRNIPVILFVALIGFKLPLDLDLGWHLRYGQYFFQTGHVLKDNILSFVWPDYHWVQASWGFDLFLYQIYIHTGFIGISIIGSLFTVLIFLLITYPFKRFGVFQYLFLATVFLVETKPLYAASLRTQTPSTIFFAVALIIAYSSLNSYLKKGFLYQKSFYLLPILFFIWANLHGGFALGLLVTLLIWLGHGYLIFYRRIKKADFEVVSINRWLSFGALLAVSFLTPVLNPWGLKLYGETFLHASNTNLAIIREWMPLYISLSETILASVLVALVIVVATFTKKLNNIPYIIGFLFVTYLGFSAIRFQINFGVMATYFLAQNINNIATFNFANRKFFVIAAKVLLVSFIFFDTFITKRHIVLPHYHLADFSWDGFCQANYECSEEITNAMLANPPKGNGYHPYNYGGYLSWRVPQVKTFVDGRMLVWEKDGKTPPVDGDSIIIERTPINFRRFESKYNFMWVIIPTQSYITNYLEGLVKNGLWEKRYQDDLWSYYVKKAAN